MTSRKSSTRLAAPLLALYWVPIPVTLLFQVASEARVVDLDYLLNEVGWRLGYGAFPTVGALIVARQRSNVIGWFCPAIASSSASAGRRRSTRGWP